MAQSNQPLTAGTQIQPQTVTVPITQLMQGQLVQTQGQHVQFQAQQLLPPGKDL